MRHWINAMRPLWETKILPKKKKKKKKEKKNIYILDLTKKMKIFSVFYWFQIIMRIDYKMRVSPGSHQLKES